MGVEYDPYMHSAAWARRRRIALDNAGGMCQRCFVRPDDPDFGRPLEVHHLTYKNLGHEQAEDLIVLCTNCHEVADSERQIITMLRSARSSQARDAYLRQAFDSYFRLHGLEPHEVDDSSPFFTFLDRHGCAGYAMSKSEMRDARRGGG
jgi:hypothetical protein